MSSLHDNYQAYLELQDQIKALQEKATLLMMEGRVKAIEDIGALVKVYEIKAEEIGLAAAPNAPARKPEKRRDRAPKSPPKYRDPDSGATWTGKGRVPDWLIGKDYDDFLIDMTAQPSDYAPAASPAVDASDAVRNMVSAGMPQTAAAWPSSGVAPTATQTG